MKLDRKHRRIRAVVLVAMRLAVVAWLVVGRTYSGWFWAGLATLIAATAGLGWREYRQLDLESSLEVTIDERTTQLQRERRREQERNRVLEMLVAHEPLGTVLDQILRSIRDQCPLASCAALMRRGDGCQITAAVEMPPHWLSTLRMPHSLPFELWRQPLDARNMAADPAWRRFRLHLEGDLPGYALSQPISNTEGQPAAIMLLYPGGSEPRIEDRRALDVARRLAGLALEQNRLYESLSFQAHHDSLTGLPNRLLFDDRLDRAMREADKLGRQFALLFIDLDLFKNVNDTYSHRLGDMFLRELADRMNKAVRDGDMVGRIGGDEFTILLADLKDPAEASEIAGRVLQSLRQPVFIEGREIQSSASVGIAIFPEDGKDIEKLQRAADAAMYSAKQSGRDRVETFSTRNEMLDRARMDEDLRVALREGHFEVHYQPKVGADRNLAGFEALIRMNHPVLGRVPPMSFIPAAESNGLIVPIGAWVLEEVCRQIAVWESCGLDPISVAVNVSPVQICRGDFAQSVAECLARHHVCASRLEVELTESLMITGGGAAQEQLKALRALGVRLSIDDFGTGYSSLSYLHRLPIDAIKLDRSFVQSIDTDDLARRLVHAMIGVADGLGLKVVAEGVETEAQREALIDAGCPLMQGFLFSKPHPAAELEEFLRPSVANTHLSLSQLAAAVNNFQPSEPLALTV